MERIDKLLSFLKECEKYKFIEREIFLTETRKENDAEHTWHLGMFIFLFENDLPEGIDTLKIYKMALIHDLVEIYAGDTYCFDHEKRKSKKEREEQAKLKIVKLLPKDVGKEFRLLFEEYEEHTTKEAQIVKSFDKIQPILTNIAKNGLTWKKKNVKYHDVDSYKGKYMDHDKMIKKIYTKIMHEAKEKGLLK